MLTSDESCDGPSGLAASDSVTVRPAWPSAGRPRDPSGDDARGGFLDSGPTGPSVKVYSSSSSAAVC